MKKKYIYEVPVVNFYEGIMEGDHVEFRKFSDAVAFAERRRRIDFHLFECNLILKRELDTERYVKKAWIRKSNAKWVKTKCVKRLFDVLDL